MYKTLLYSALALLLLSGCNEKSQEKQNIQENKPKLVEEKKEEKPLLEKVKSSSENITQKVSEASKQIGDIVAQTSKEVGKEASVVTKELVEKSNEITKQLSQEVEKSANKLEDTINSMMSSSKKGSDEGQRLFMKCAGCHGKKGELVPTIGRSKVIRGWDKVKTIYALKGYQKGTYGKAMKGVMRAQVATLSDKEIEVLADYISKL